MKLLKFIYRGLLTGLPSLTYNPYKLNTFIAPFEVLPMSTYINYKLNKEQLETVSNFLSKMSSNKSELIRSHINNYGEQDYFLSVNVYNCTSPVFDSFSKESSRCEINTYINNIDFGLGTVILDYTSNSLSMDPVNKFKSPETTMFKNINNTIICKSKNNNIDFSLNYTFDYSKDKSIEIDEDLVKLTDKIYYTNGIFDKLYYDTSLTHAELYKPLNISELYFKFLGLEFGEPDSVFYFKNEIRFTGGLWENLYKF
jgi:hypothetical protein